MTYLARDVDTLIAKLAKVSVGSRELDADVSRIFDPGHRSVFYGGGVYAGVISPFTTIIDAAMTLLAKSIIQFSLFSYHGHERWGAKCHDTAQFYGEKRAEQSVKRLYESTGLKPPFMKLEKALAEQFCDFAVLDAATPALAVCLLALKVKIGRIVDDEIWPMEETNESSGSH